MGDDFDLQAELDRKGGEALSWLANEHGQGAITDAEYVIGLTMFDMTNLGLIDRDLSTWATNARVSARMMKGSPLKDKAVMVKGVKTVVITLYRVTAAVHITAAPGMGIAPRRHTYDTPREAIVKFEEAVTALKNKGYEELV